MAQLTPFTKCPSKGIKVGRYQRKLSVSFLPGRLRESCVFFHFELHDKLSCEISVVIQIQYKVYNTAQRYKYQTCLGQLRVMYWKSKHATSPQFPTCSQVGAQVVTTNYCGTLLHYQGWIACVKWLSFKKRKSNLSIDDNTVFSLEW